MVVSRLDDILALMNSDLIQDQSVGGTENPQSSQGAPLANEASQFQTSADNDVLKQNRPIQVESTGQSITADQYALDPSPRSMGQAMNDAITYYLLVFIAAIVITGFVGTVIFKRVFTKPVILTEKEPIKAVKSSVATKSKTPQTKTKATSKSAKSSKSKVPKGKKKPTRSKRRKQ